MQSIVLLAIVAFGSRAGCSEPTSAARDGADREPDAGLDALIAEGPDGDVADAAPLVCVDAIGCRTMCEGSNWRRADACVRWADLLRAPHGTNVRRDRIGAREVHRTTCYLHEDPLACTRVALAAGFLHDLDLAPDWQNPALAPLGLLAAACSTPSDRGALACAAIEILAPTSELSRARRLERCAGDGAARARCAAATALAACRDDDAESCYLAARDPLPTRDEARDRLRKLCGGEDRPACLYLFALSPPKDRDRKSLVAACSLGDQKDESIASACLARTLVRDLDPRPARFAEFACELGSCQHPQLPRPAPVVLNKSCKAGHVNGCANLIFVNRASPGAWRPIVDEVNGRAATYVRRVPADREADEVACDLGSLEACTSVLKRIGTKDPARAARLEAFVRRLVDPFAER